MIYGMCGSSGSGKTTLCHKVAQSLDLTVVETSITDMARKAGYDPVAPMEKHERVQLQKALYTQFEELLAGLKGPAILDRTPLDLVLYMMAEIDMHSADYLTAEDLAWVANYVADCRKLTERYFDHVFLVAPRKDYTAVNTRPPVNPAYQMHCHLLMMGQASLLEMGWTMVEGDDDEMRFEISVNMIEDRLNFIETHRRSSAYIH